MKKLHRFELNRENVLPVKYLVTGGAGFIGSHLSEALIKQGHEVTVLDDLSTGSVDNVQHLLNHERFELKVGSVLDSQVLEDLVSRCDRVFHLAAAVGVDLILTQQLRSITINVTGTENILKIASRYGKKVLVASTSEVYGNAMQVNGTSGSLREDGEVLLGPTSVARWGYACAKALDEFLALAYYRENNLPVVLVRFFNTVGPRQTGRYGMVVPKFVRAALMGEPVRVFGDGEQSRCFLHVRDAVEAIMRLMDNPSCEGEVFNVGSSEEISINHLARRVLKLTGSMSPVVHVPYSEAYVDGFGEIIRRVPDITKLQAFTGFQPRITTDEILLDVIAYMRERESVFGEAARAVI